VHDPLTTLASKLAHVLMHAHQYAGCGRMLQTPSKAAAARTFLDARCTYEGYDVLHELYGRASRLLSTGRVATIYI
jgi:hypothetical protein